MIKESPSQNAKMPYLARDPYLKSLALKLIDERLGATYRIGSDTDARTIAQIMNDDHLLFSRETVITPDQVNNFMLYINEMASTV